ncbi:TRAP transporter substrate-binding protein [Thaumasiovibrio sp. DFM-14]|uniref:TRAP transporter substrate-binding protein n=1 Tax=Thaumasiovibrio sp. DFM-14 TaxID=3384792 RepID=UPI0039A33EDB
MRVLILLSLLLLLLGCEPQQSNKNNQSVVWRLATTWPAQFPGLGEAPLQLAKLVEEASSGQFIIDVYGAGEVVPSFELFRAVSKQTVEMGHSSAYYWQDLMPAAPFFSAVPFGMRAAEMNGWLYFGGGLELWRSLYAPYGIIPYPGGNSGPQMGGWFNHSIESVEDLVGLKIRIPGFGASVLKSIGAIPIQLAGDELYSAFERGIIDAMEWVGPYNDLSFGLHQLGRYYYYPAWHEPSTQMEFLVNQAAFDSLPLHYQRILEMAMHTVNEQLEGKYLIKNQQALDAMLHEHNVVLRRFPPVVLAVLKQHTDNLLLTLASHDPQFHQIYTSYSNHLLRLRNMRNLSGGL